MMVPSVVITVASVLWISAITSVRQCWRMAGCENSGAGHVRAAAGYLYANETAKMETAE